MVNKKSNLPSMQLMPIGVVRSDIKTPMMSADENDLTLNERMEIK